MAASAVFPGMRFAPESAPGVYESPLEVGVRTTVRMDVAAFLGLTERGPVGVPVPVESWQEFQFNFGGAVSGPLLPQAVHHFFVNGGRRCVVVRTLYGADERDPEPERAIAAQWPMPGIVLESGATVRIAARDPGEWGNGLRITSRVRASARRVRAIEPASQMSSAGATTLTIDTPLAPIAEFSSIRVVGRSNPVPVLASVKSAEPTGPDGDQLILRLVEPLPPELWQPGDPLPRVEEIGIDISVFLDRVRESWSGLALHPNSGRYLLRVLAEESRLVTPRLQPDDWRSLAIVGDSQQFFGGSSPLIPGRDGAHLASRESLLDGGGRSLLRTSLDALLGYNETHVAQPVSLIHLPDLALPDSRPNIASLAADGRETSTRFGPCSSGDGAFFAGWSDYGGLRVDTASHLREVAEVQSALIAWCERHRGVVAVIDSPPGINRQQLVELRRHHASPRAALYGPYLRAPDAADGAAGALVTAAPGGAVCGLIARTERERGVWAAPANAVLEGVVSTVDERLPDSVFLYEQRVNEIRQTEIGLAVMGSRTTAVEREWTHLSVRRLLDYLMRQIPIDLAWSVFEPHNEELWPRIELSVAARLDELFEVGALEGATTDEAYFVRCDESTNPPSQRDVGQVRALVGVAPAVPAEFIVFQLTLRGDGAVLTEERSA